MAAPQPVTLLCIGAMPNIRAALQRNPEIAQRVRFVGMHGSVRLGYGGKSKPDPEANVVVDVAAARAVFTTSWPMTITPLDTCGLVQLTGENYRKVAESSDPLARAVIENYRIWRKVADPKAKEPAHRQLHALRHRGDPPRPLRTTGSRMEELPIVISDDGFTRIDPEGKRIACAMAWTDLGAFEDFLVRRRLTGQK